MKWWILLSPTFVIGLWEYIRHQWLLPFISMEVGNWLSAGLVFLVTITLLRRLFRRYEQLQEKLRVERTQKAVLEERQRMARQLHDGIAQSLFLCAVHVEAIKERHPELTEWGEIENTMSNLHSTIRSAITNLKNPSDEEPLEEWAQRLQLLVDAFTLDTGIAVHLRADEDEEKTLTSKEKVELLACLQEALTNIRKHAAASEVKITFRMTPTGWSLDVTDNGKGFSGNPFRHPDHFGLGMMNERALELGAKLSFVCTGGKTTLRIAKEGGR
ncbi:sensor histidine kinase [Mechercharimyces sp. CAU 1602]|uniref:sensor histidine kinase n=1 Tax=Mechercharimyces sp. CAU 1602 TaxID=2973933 RepID=UPI0021621D3F|nr:histidine kinase [Mechercharimyces sp. CAU 1602]